MSSRALLVDPESIINVPIKCLRSPASIDPNAMAWFEFANICSTRDEQSEGAAAHRSPAERLN